MKAALIVLTFLSAPALAVPAFDCTDIHGDHKYTGSDGYIDQKLGAGYGSYVYKLSNIEINILKNKFDDGFYYGQVYSISDYNQYYDIKCKVIE